MRITTREVLIGVLLFAAGIFIAAMLATNKPWMALLLNERYAVVWSGIFGAFIAAGVALFGVLAANASSLERLRVQHVNDAAEAVKQREHDALQKEEDRKAAIRREVYTDAAEKVHACIAAIGGLPEKPFGLPDGDAEPLQAFLRASSKVWLVAEAKGAHLSRELGSLMSELYMDVLLRASPLRNAMEPVRDIDKRLVHADAEVQRTAVKFMEMKEANGSQESLESMQASCVRASEWVKTLKDERRRVILTLQARRFAHAEYVGEAMFPMQRMLVKLVSALRAELGLLPEEAEFLAQLEDAQQRAMAALKRAFGAVTDSARA